jgi:hypothetical protein
VKRIGSAVERPLKELEEHGKLEILVGSASDDIRQILKILPP